MPRGLTTHNRRGSELPGGSLQMASAGPQPPSVSSLSADKCRRVVHNCHRPKYLRTASRLPSNRPSCQPPTARLVTLQPPVGYPPTASNRLSCHPPTARLVTLQPPVLLPSNRPSCHPPTARQLPSNRPSCSPSVARLVILQPPVLSASNRPSCYPPTARRLPSNAHVTATTIVPQVCTPSEAPMSPIFWTCCRTCETWTPRAAPYFPCYWTPRRRSPLARPPKAGGACTSAHPPRPLRTRFPASPSPKRLWRSWCGILKRNTV